MNLKQFLSPPIYSDEEKNLQAHALHVLLLYLSIFAAVLGSLSVIFIFPAKVTTGLTLVAGVSTFLYLIYLNHHGHVLTAARIFFAVYWLLITVQIVLSNGMRSLDIMFYVTGTVAVGLILGFRSAIYFALLTIVVGFGMAILAETGLVIFPDLYPFPPLSSWTLLMFNLLFTIMLLNISYKRISDALTLARQEIREREQVEKALRASEEKFEKAFRASPDSITISEAHIEGRYIEVNDGFVRVIGYNREEAINHSAQELNLWVHPEEQIDILDKVIKNGRITNEETVLRTKAGDLIYCLLSAELIEIGSELCVVFISRDITNYKEGQLERERLIVELERSNRELQDFAYISSHDLQEPLRKIQTFADRLQSKYAVILDNSGRTYLARMQESAARSQVLIQDLLTYSRLSTHKQPFAPVDLTAVIRDVLSDLIIQIDETQAELIVGSLPRIEADKTQMRQLFQNLIGNALKFHRPGVTPVIEIDTVADADLPDGYCQITVTDNGIGFEEKYLDRIFTVFQRLHSSEEYEGTGIGLAICRRIVERHHGRISASSQQGVGSRFSIILPIGQVAVSS